MPLRHSSHVWDAAHDSAACRGSPIVQSNRAAVPLSLGCFDLLKGWQLKTTRLVSARSPLVFHPVTERVVLPVSPSVPFSLRIHVCFPECHSWRGHRWKGCAGYLQACNRLRCHDLCRCGRGARKAEEGSSGKDGDDGRRHPSKGCRPALLLLLLLRPVRRAFAGLHACCIGFVPSCAQIGRAHV